LKQAARSIKPKDAAKDDAGLDFLGFGPHSLRRANITWRQEVGGSSIETSKIAGHASTAITEEYTLVGLHHQDELTRLIQTKRARATRKVNRSAGQQTGIGRIGGATRARPDGADRTEGAQGRCRSHEEGRGMMGDRTGSQM
jgi:hypothetical protein